MEAKKSRLGRDPLDLLVGNKKPRKTKTKNPSKPKAETIQANFLIWPEQKKQIIIYGAEHDLKPSEVVRQAIDKFFKNTRKQGT